MDTNAFAKYEDIRQIRDRYHHSLTRIPHAFRRELEEDLRLELVRRRRDPRESVMGG